MRFLSLRNRLLQTIILGLIGLTFYTYYRTTDSEIQQYALFRHYYRSLYESTPVQPQQHLHATANASSDTPSTLLSRNLSNSTEQFTLINPINASHNANLGGNLSTVMTVIAASSLQTLSSSSNTAIKISSSSTSTTTTTTTTTTTIAPSTVPVIDKRSTRAIYVPGHKVTAAHRCPDFGRSMDLVVFVMSAPAHYMARNAIRYTWGHHDQENNISIVFMLGRTNNSAVEKKLDEEVHKYGDIVRGNFVDSYSNLTLKTISALEWVHTYCSKVKFVLKTDDDMFINFLNLTSFINKHKRVKKVIFGKLAKNWAVVRNKKSKYFISPSEYKPATYPNFCTGPAYLMSSDVVHDLYERALRESFFKLEDVFVTGIVANKLGIKRMDCPQFLNRKIRYDACKVQHSISIHMVTYSDQFELWKKLLDGKSNCKNDKL